MPTAFAEPEVKDLEAAQASDEELREALSLKESVSISEAGVQDDGTIVLDLIRPCVGRGKGRHLYTADMLRENAHKLVGWKSYVDHLSDEAQKALGGLPRSVRDLGGRLTETWWNAEVPADPARGFGKGAVQGKMKPVPFVRELVENDPEIVEFSINSNATGVKPVLHQGQRVMLVEGIQDKGSVDCVTEAGAGGRVAQLMESVYAEEGAAQVAVLEAMDEDELREYLKAERPELVEAMEKPGDGEGDGGGTGTDGDDDAARSAGGGNGKQGLNESPDGEGGEVEITAEQLREAFETDDGRAMVLNVVREVAGDDLRSLVEAGVEEERLLIRREAEAVAERRVVIRDMRDAARKQIRESRLPEPAQVRAMEKFDLKEGVPTPALDLVDDLDDSGQVTKSATDKLHEAVEAEIEEQREFVAAIRPARVTGQGASGGGEGEGKGEAKPYAVPERTKAVLKEAGFNDPDEVYAPAS